LPVGVRTTRPPMSNAAKAGICVAIAVVVPTVLSFATGGLALAMFVPFYFVALVAAGAQILRSRYDEKRRRRGQLPPPPMQSGQALEGDQNAKSGDDWVLCRAHRAARARHLPGHGIIQRIVWSLRYAGTDEGLRTSRSSHSHPGRQCRAGQQRVSPGWSPTDLASGRAEGGGRSTHSPPFSIYSAPGGLPQDPGRAA
jgi:hypothetical protein